MTDKLIYFTADKVPTVTEAAEIAVLEDLKTPPFELVIRNGADETSYGATDESADLVAGTIPTAYSEVDEFGVISAVKPLLFDIWPKTAAITGTATKQLYPVKVTGTNALDLVSAAVATGVAYTSSDETKATVHATSGLITGVAAGITTITATYTYASGKTVTSTCAVTVS